MIFTLICLDMGTYGGLDISFDTSNTMSVFSILMFGDQLLQGLLRYTSDEDGMWGIHEMVLRISQLTLKCPSLIRSDVSRSR